MSYIYLAIAIISEVIGTSAITATDGFTRLVPSIVTLVGYGVSFYFLALAVRTIPVGITYAIWSGVGVVLIVVIGWTYYDQKLDRPALFGIALIVAGVIVMNLFSESTRH